MNTKKLPIAVQEQLKSALGQGIQKYLSLPEEKRHELESQGINFSTFLYDSVAPLLFTSKVNKVLVVMEEGIGNMVMLTPALRMLRHINPRLHITVWGKEPSVQVIKGWNVIDKVITEFDYEYYDLCFFTIWSQQYKMRFGKLLQQYCKSTFEVEFRDFHEAIQHMFISDFLSGYGDLCETHCEMAKDKDYEELMKLMVNTKLIITKEQTKNYELGGKITDKSSELKKYIVFGDTTLRNFSWERKRWPYYQELAKLIHKKFTEYKIILIGDEYDYQEAKQKTWPENVILDFMGKINIPQLAYLIKNAEFYIGNDTGPTHISAAVGTKTYTLFGPSKVSKNRPLGKNVIILNKKIPCSPCQYTERWESCSDWICLSELTAHEVYNTIFYPQNSKIKKSILLVGDFSKGYIRNEIYIKRIFEKEYGLKVIPFDYRLSQKKHKGNFINASYEIVNEIIYREPNLVLICGGQQIIPDILIYVNYLLPKTRLSNLYVDNRGQIEQWFAQLSSICHYSYWHTGDPKLLSQVFSQTQRPCEFFIMCPDDKHYYPLEIKKDIDVLFAGTPHSKDRIDLLEYLIDNKVNIRIYGDGIWNDKLKPHVKSGIYGAEYNHLLNRTKIIINQNIINNVPLYFSERYFFPMAVKTVGLNYKIPNIEDMFEGGKHMEFWTTKEECLSKINKLLKDDNKCKYISEEGYKLYKEKYTLTKSLKTIVDLI